jgi:hypothetical protein
MTLVFFIFQGFIIKYVTCCFLLNWLSHSSLYLFCVWWSIICLVFVHFINSGSWEQTLSSLPSCLLFSLSLIEWSMFFMIFLLVRCSYYCKFCMTNRCMITSLHVTILFWFQRAQTEMSYRVASTINSVTRETTRLTEVFIYIIDRV